MSIRKVIFLVYVAAVCGALGYIGDALLENAKTQAYRAGVSAGKDLILNDLDICAKQFTDLHFLASNMTQICVLNKEVARLTDDLDTMLKKLDKN